MPPVHQRHNTGCNTLAYFLLSPTEECISVYFAFISLVNKLEDNCTPTCPVKDLLPSNRSKEQRLKSGLDTEIKQNEHSKTACL